MVPTLMRRLYGSDNLFPDDRMNAYHPHQSVNHITSHDGFTLYDLVAYNQKRNWPNGHGNTDGMADNLSWNCGWEGDEGAPPAVMTLRKQQIENFCCLLFLSNGTPMIRAGDEFMHTQAGNNNPYNQDNEVGWIDWGPLHAHPDIFRFFKLMIAFRKAHPSQRAAQWTESMNRRMCPTRGLDGELDLTEPPADLAARVRALLKQCCRMCVPGHEHACERRTAVPFEAVESPGRLDATGPLDPRLQARLTQVSGRPLTRTNRVRLLRDGADTFTAMLELIEHAETEILLENYIIRADAVGRASGEALVTRTQAGVDVRILHDPFGPSRPAHVTVPHASPDSSRSKIIASSRPIPFRPRGRWLAARPETLRSL